MICVLIFFSTKGFFKGFLSTLFSLFGIFFVLYVSYLLTDSVVEIIKDIQIFDSGLFNMIKSTLDNLLPGEFHSIEDVLVELSGRKLNSVLLFALNLIAKNIAIDGAFSFGGVFAPVVYDYLLKIIAFILIFIVLTIVVEIVKWCVGFVFLKSRLSAVDRVLGMVMGLAKGFVFFLVLYCLLFLLTSFTTSEMLQKFLASGNITNVIYGFMLKFLI